MEMVHWLIIPTAYALDALLGDPPSLPHPIRWMGKSIEVLEPACRKWTDNELIAGLMFAVTLIMFWWGASSAMVHAVYWLHPGAGIVLEVILIYYCLSVRSLSDAGMEIHRLLSQGRVDDARSALAMIVGRDVNHYQEEEISRAAVETVAENFVDGVLSPLFFAAVGGAPLAVAFKIINTMDSMVGYKNDRYLRFGRTAARIDDIANFIPARLSAPIIALAAGWVAPGSGGQALRTAMAEGNRHSSPNAGYPEAAFAGALAVKLNGPNFYAGVLVEKPYIGAAFGAAGVAHISKGCQLMMLSAVISMALAWVLSVGIDIL